MKWIFITGNPDLAAAAEGSGVQRVMVDLETRGKAERQESFDTHKTRMTMPDVEIVRRVLKRAELIVRLNPLYAGTSHEVDRAISLGAERLMLPMFSDAADVAQFRDIVPRNISITLLAETPESIATLPDWTGLLSAGDDVHFGLNDLTISMRLHFLFQILTGRFLEGPTTALKEAGIEYGIGGIGRVGVGAIEAQRILGEVIRLGSSRTILSRAFRNAGKSNVDTNEIRPALTQLEQLVAKWRTADAAEYQENFDALCEQVRLVLLGTMSERSGQSDAK